MKIIFSRSSTIGSLLIRGGTWSVWSHCGIFTHEDTVIDSTMEHGVSERPVLEWTKDISAYDVIDVDCPNPQDAIKWARTQIGKAYDWTAIIGFGFHREWNKDDKWFCSEFVEAALTQGGRKRWRNPRRITPQQTWNAQ